MCCPGPRELYATSCLEMFGTWFFKPIGSQEERSQVPMAESWRGLRKRLQKPVAKGAMEASAPHCWDSSVFKIFEDLWRSLERLEIFQMLFF